MNPPHDPGANMWLWEVCVCHVFLSHESIAYIKLCFVNLLGDLLATSNELLLEGWLTSN